MKEVLRSRLSLTVLVLALVSLSYAFSQNHYSNHAVTGEELNDLILENQDKIIVTLWTMNIQNEDVQNKKNNIAKSSMRRLVSKCHNQVIYNEADVSDYRHDEGSYSQLADEWNLDLNQLRNGPMVMAVFQKKGEMFWSTYDTMLIKLLDRVDAYIRQIQANQVGGQGESPKCSVKLDYNELDTDFKNNLSTVSIGPSGSGLGSSSASGLSRNSGSYSGKGPYRSSSYDNIGDSYRSISLENSQPAYLSNSYDNVANYGRTSSGSHIKGSMINGRSTGSSSGTIEIRADEPKPVYQVPEPKAVPKPKPKINLKEPNKALLRNY